MHKVVNVVKIAQALAEQGININAIGGGEGVLNDTPVGMIAMLVSSDEVDGEASGIIARLDLGQGHTLVSAVEYEALDLELDDVPGSLASATSLLGNNEVNIMGIMTVDVHVGWAIVSLGFEDTSTRNAARELLTNNGFKVLLPHGGEGRRREVDDLIKDAQDT